MWDKLFEIKEVLDKHEDLTPDININLDMDGSIGFHLTDIKTFIKLGLENSCKYKVRKIKDSEYPYRLTTTKDGLTILTIATEEEFKIIEDKLF